MSCIIDRLCRLRQEVRGSILMEFVLVLPIYFVFFGYVFLIGDLGLKTIALASGDRDAAMDAGDRWGYSYPLFGSNQMVDSGLRAAQSATLRAEEDFKGAWSWQAAGLSSFSYRLPNWMSGFLVYPYLHYGSASAGGALSTLAKGNTIELRSKDRGNVRIFNYYTLKRTDLAREEGAYRNWKPNQLVKAGGGLRQYWESGVYDEPFANSGGEKLDSDGWAQGSDELPSPPKGASEYKRYGQFLTWSQ